MFLNNYPMRRKTENWILKIVLSYLIIFGSVNLEVFCEYQWNNDPDFIGVHTLRHQSHGDEGTQGRQPTINIRHHNHRHHTTTTTTTTTTSKPLTASEIGTTVGPSAEDHHLRHSNKFYQTWELYRDPKYTARRRYIQSHHTTQAPAKEKNHRTAHRRSSTQNHHSRSPSHLPFTTDRGPSVVNVTTVMKSRYFDRDAIYTPNRASSVKSHHPYDILKTSSHKDRHLHNSRPTKKRFDDPNYDDDNNMWSNSFDSSEKWSFSKSPASSFALKSFQRNNKWKTNSRRYDEQSDSDLNFDEDESQKMDTDKQIFDDEDVDDIYSKSYIPGTLTKHKLDTLGTHEAVKESRHAYLTNQQQKKALADAHATRIYSEATCRWPKPKIIAVQNDPAKTYLPHCTILHRCGDDTGCCNTDTRTCIASSLQSVDLYFYVSTLGNKQGTIEKQTFVNHTECQCVDKFSQPSYPAPEQMRKATVISCTCPKLFEKVLQEDGICRCDCSSSNTGCDWKKKGKEHFSMEDRRCIMEGRCKIPTCEYGKYDKRHGRCPRKEDKLAIGFSYHQK